MIVMVFLPCKYSNEYICNWKLMAASHAFQRCAKRKMKKQMNIEQYKKLENINWDIIAEESKRKRAKYLSENAIKIVDDVKDKILKNF
jgi:hypothetical protein